MSYDLLERLFRLSFVFLFVSIVDVKVRANSEPTILSAPSAAREDIMFEPANCGAPHELNRYPCAIGTRAGAPLDLKATAAHRLTIFPSSVVQLLSRTEFRIVSGRVLIESQNEKLTLSFLGVSAELAAETEVMVDVRMPTEAYSANETRASLVVLRGSVDGTSRPRSRGEETSRMTITAGLTSQVERLVSLSLPTALEPRGLGEVLAVLDPLADPSALRKRLEALAQAASKPAASLHSDALSRRLASLDEDQRRAEETRRKAAESRREIQETLRLRVLGQHGLSSSFDR
jgi:hypothetical protein